MKTEVTRVNSGCNVQLSHFANARFEDFPWAYQHSDVIAEKFIRVLGSNEME